MISIEDYMIFWLFHLHGKFLKGKRSYIVVKSDITDHFISISSYVV